MRHGEGVCEERTLRPVWRRRKSSKVSGRSRLHCLTMLFTGLLGVGSAGSVIQEKSVNAGEAVSQAKTPPLRSQTLREGAFHSGALNREMRYRVIVPAGYDTSDTRYPTLYLLHGLYGDFTNWSAQTRIVEYAKGLNLIIAMPDAGNSWYADSATKPADKFETYFIRDFITEIEARYRTLPEARARAVAGLSMGGYAAIKFSLKFPGTFSFVGAMSAALDAPGDLEERHPEFLEGLRTVFGERGNSARAQNDVFLLLSSARTAGLPYFDLDCGSDDMFLMVNRKFAARLQEQKVPYEAHEFPGDHNWRYWDAAIERFLATLTRRNFGVRR